MIKMAVIVVMELSPNPLNRPYSPHTIHSNTYTTVKSLCNHLQLSQIT